jgi:hypothetical protein
VAFVSQGLRLMLYWHALNHSSGTQWKCNLCARVHDLPPDFDYDIVKRRNVDRAERVELNSAVVEYIAPPEYCVCL